MSRSIETTVIDKPVALSRQDLLTDAKAVHKRGLCLLRVCTACQGKCCVGRTMVTEEEREQIIAYSLKDHFVHWRSDVYYLDKGVCPYLKNGLCSVQEVKPFVCQIFPFVPRVVDGEFWLYCVSECEAGRNLPPGFTDKAKALAQVFFANRSAKEYADYWNRNKIGDFDEREVTLKIKVYDHDQKRKMQS